MTTNDFINFKSCSQCKKNKSLTEFYKSKKSLDGLRCECKDCCMTYQRSPTGLVVRIYGHQVSHSLTRGDIRPEYSMEDLKEWLFSHNNFNNLYESWVKSGYERMLAPSCDRLDDYKPYTIGNIQLTTWQENHDKGHSDRKNGINKKQLNKTIQMSMSGDFIAEYYSMMQASRETGIIFQNISKCCKGKRSHAGGYKWTYA